MIEKEPVGKIEYGDAGSQIFYDKDEYIKAFKEAMDVYGVMGGFKATTLTRDQETRKAYDDALYNEFGEENPYALEHYQEKYAQATEAPAEEAQPELEGEEMEL